MNRVEHNLEDFDNEMLPEYNFKGGVRGKHFQAYRKGYSVIIHHADGTTTEEHFDMKDQKDRIPADKIADEPQ